MFPQREGQRRYPEPDHRAGDGVCLCSRNAEVQEDEPVVRETGLDRGDVGWLKELCLQQLTVSGNCVAR